MQALIDYDGWRKWRDTREQSATEATKKKKKVTVGGKAKNVKKAITKDDTSTKAVTGAGPRESADGARDDTSDKDLAKTNDGGEGTGDGESGG